MTETDALVIGAGPAGLFQAFQLGLQELSTHIVDPLPRPGGQCVELYPDKPIYDIPGLPRCTGAELAERLQQQLAPLRPGWHLEQQVGRLQPRTDGRFDVGTTSGATFIARTVFIAAGVGAFLPRTLKLPGIDAFEGRQFFHRLPDAAALAGRHVLLMGDEDPALAAALQLSALAGPQAPASVTLMHRRDGFRAAPALVAQMREAVADSRMRLLIAQPQGVVGSSDLAQAQLSGLTVLDRSGELREVRTDVLIALLGLSPRLGPVAEWGLAMEHKQLVVDPGTCETSHPGIYAVGDVVSYPHKKKLILSAFHEATMAAFAAAARLHPQRPPLLEYTSASSRLQRLLGVDGHGA